RRDRVDVEGARVELENLRLADPLQVLIADGADQDDLETNEGGAVKVRRREDILWVEVELATPARGFDDQVIVDAEVGIVEILMLAGDMDHAPVRQRGAGATEALPAPEWSAARLTVGGFGEVATVVGVVSLDAEMLAQLVGRPVLPDGLLPQLVLHPLGMHR